MSKKKDDSSDAKFVEQLATVTKKRDRAIPIRKYFDSVRSDVHPYQRAFLERRYLGIMKTEHGWSEELVSELGEKE